MEFGGQFVYLENNPDEDFEEDEGFFKKIFIVILFLLY